MALLRTNVMEEKYRTVRNSLPKSATCVLCEKKPVHQFKFWKIVVNDFPYDYVAAEHHMLVPLRHAKEAVLNADECAELLLIKTESQVLPNYDFIMEATDRIKTIPDHFHLHLVSIKERPDS